MAGRVFLFICIILILHKRAEFPQYSSVLFHCPDVSDGKCFNLIISLCVNIKTVFKKNVLILTIYAGMPYKMRIINH